MHESPSLRAWTFADQVSSYRFWALLVAWLCVALNSQWLRTGVMQNLRDQLGLSGVVEVVGLTMPLGIVTGIVAGLLVVRGHTALWLGVAALLAGVVLPAGLALLEETSVPMLMLHLWSGDFLNYCFMLAVTASIAGSRGNSVVFAAVLALVWLLKAAVDTSAIVIFMQLTYHWPQVGWPMWGMAAAGLAVLLLVPLLPPSVRILFAGEPPVRHRPLAKYVRQPWAAALWGALLWLGSLTAIGLLWHDYVHRYEIVQNPVWVRLAMAVALVGWIGVVRWNYRIHGEIAALAPSPHLLTPRAAALATVLMPLSVVLLPLQLAAVLKQSHQERVSVGWLVCWSLLLPAVAMAQIQRAVNQATHRAAV